MVLKPWTPLLYDSFSLKNLSMQEKQAPVRTARFLKPWTVLTVPFFQQIPALIKALAGMHFELFGLFLFRFRTKGFVRENKTNWDEEDDKLSRGCAKLQQQASNPAQIVSHGFHLHLHLHLLLLFLLLLSSFRLRCCGLWFLTFSLWLFCYWCIHFYVSKIPFTWHCNENEENVWFLN